MRTGLHGAYLIHRRPYRETSLQIEVFSQEFGRVGLIAKGANRPKSSLRAALHAFTPLLVSWVGGSELGVLTAAEIDGPSLNLNGRALWSAFYLNELLLRLLPRSEPHPGLFAGYALALKELSTKPTEAPVLRRFEKLLLDQIGYGLSLEKDVTGAPIVAEQDYYYQYDKGALRETVNSSGSLLVKGETLRALASGEFLTPTVEREAKYLMRYVLQHYLGKKPLNSRKLFEKPRSLTGSEVNK